MKLTRDVIAAQGEPLPKNMKTKWKSLKGDFHALVRWVEANLHIGGKEVSLENPVPVTSTVSTTSWRTIIDYAPGKSLSRVIPTKGYSTVLVLMRGQGSVAAQVSDDGKNWWDIPEWRMQGNEIAGRLSCSGVDYIRFGGQAASEDHITVKIRLYR